MQLENEHTMRLTRRTHCAALALAVALAGCGDNVPARGPADAPPAPAEEVAMAATFEVDGASALVSIHAEASRSARVRVTSADGAVIADVGPIALEPERGRTGVAALEGLTPDTAYEYVVELERGAVVGPYEFRTAPAPDAAVDVHFVWSADVDLSAEFESPIFATMSASGAAFFVSLGDWPYADNAPAARTVEEYRDRHRAVRGAGKVQELLRALPVYAIYDDHEARNDWDGRFRVEEAERIANAVKVWDEWFPLRATRAGQEGRWRSWRWGRHAELFLLDTRCCRSANRDPDGPDKTMLGAQQKQWLIDALAASDATFKILLTSVPMIGDSPDDWNVFVAERSEILDELAARGVSGLVALAGDGHLFLAARLPDRGLREFMAGPLARHPGELEAPHPTIIDQYQGFNYGEARITTGADGVPALEITCRDARGGACYREVLRASDLVLVTP